MKITKKFIAVLLTFAIIFTLGIPAFAAEEGAAEDAAITQELHEENDTPEITEPEITEEEIKEILDSEEVREELEEEGIDVDDILENENTQYEYIKDYSISDLLAEQARAFFVYTGEYIFGVVTSPIAVGFLCVAFIGALPLAPVLMTGAPFVTAVVLLEDFVILFESFCEEWAAYREYNG